MAYEQRNNPFSVTSCGRRRTFMQENNESALRRLRKTTVGKGRHFRSADEGAGMTSAGVNAYKKENPGSNLKTAVTGKVKRNSKDAKRRKAFCDRSIGWKSKRGKAARARWKC